MPGLGVQRRSPGRLPHRPLTGSNPSRTSRPIPSLDPRRINLFGGHLNCQESVSRTPTDFYEPDCHTPDALLPVHAAQMWIDSASILRNMTSGIGDQRVCGTLDRAADSVRCCLLAEGR